MQALDVGSGSGYLTAIFCRILGSSGKAVGIEHISELTERATTAAAKMPFAAEALANGSLRFVTVSVLAAPQWSGVWDMCSSLRNGNES